MVNILCDTYQGINKLPDPRPPLKYPREKGFRPAPEKNPYNAWCVLGFAINVYGIV